LFRYSGKYRGYLCLAQCNVVKLGYYRNTYGIKSTRTSIKIGGKEGDEFELKDGKLILKKNEEIIKVVDMD
jgi:hypothetical protein